MNKKLGLAVAGAVLALSSAAQAGITIPAGDWTIDISGNVNAYVNSTSVDKNNDTGSAIGVTKSGDAGSIKSIQTGLLPSWIGFSGKTRQNDLDVAFTISFQPGVSEDSYTGDGALNGLGIGGGSTRATTLNRQTFLTFGDASWGSIKLGKDLGIYASDAILNDMTLLGVGAGAGLSSSLNSTAGGIGTGYQYAAWKGQVAYTSPNWNGFQFTAGIVNPNQASVNGEAQGRFGFEGKASYSFTGDVSGKVWVSGASYKINDTGLTNTSYNISAYDIGATVNYGNLGLTGYLYDGRGNGITFLGLQSQDDNGKRLDGSGGYAQATYVIPTGTKLGAAYGKSRLDGNSNTTVGGGDAAMDSQRRITIGAYHPLTKSLNLVAEYTDIRLENQANVKNEYSTLSAGAILFF